MCDRPCLWFVSTLRPTARVVVALLVSFASVGIASNPAAAATPPDAYHTELLERLRFEVNVPEVHAVLPPDTRP